jgi:hypothetical protein
MIVVIIFCLNNLKSDMILLNLAIILFIAVCTLTPITSYGRQERNEKAKDSFKYSHPCPSNGNNHGNCSGYVIDHINPLSCGGADAPSNMQWQSVPEAKAKDKWERKGCPRSISGNHSYSSGIRSSFTSSNNNYYSGSRGGCFTYTASGKKRYVYRSYCGY